MYIFSACYFLEGWICDVCNSCSWVGSWYVLVEEGSLTYFKIFTVRCDWAGYHSGFQLYVCKELIHS